jgi:hypothetical protein
MDPQYLTKEHWDLIGILLPHLTVFVALMVNTAISFLLAHAIIPSLSMTRDIPDEVRNLRRILYPISAISFVLAAFSFGRAAYLIVVVAAQIYPRFAI